MMISFFLNTIILLEYTSTIRARKRILAGLVAVIIFFQFHIIRQLDFPEGTSPVLQFLLHSFALVGVSIIDIVFAISIFYLQTIQHALFRQELEENRKYKVMFNSI